MPWWFRKKLVSKPAAEGFIGHLVELRTRLLRSLSAVLIVFLAAIPFAGEIYEILAAPLLAKLPESGSLIAVGAVSPFFVPMKAAFFLAACVAMPYVLHEIWRFVAPGLYKNEKILALPLLFSSAMLFYTGVAFAYFLVFHVVFGFIASIAPDAVSWTPDINELFGFMLALFFAFGLAFEVPVAVFILARAGVVELEDLKKARPYVIVGAFVVAAIFTPPDVISQLLLAIPCCLLYEIGLLVAPKRKRKIMLFGERRHIRRMLHMKYSKFGKKGKGTSEYRKRFRKRLTRLELWKHQREAAGKLTARERKSEFGGALESWDCAAREGLVR